MAETIKTKKIFLPVDEPDLENKHYKAVWEVAGEELAKCDLERNGELQYALYKWLMNNNDEKTGGVCEDGFFDYSANVIIPDGKIEILRAASISLKINEEKVENCSFYNDIAIIGNDTTGKWYDKSREANLRSFYQAAKRAGFDENRNYDRLLLPGHILSHDYITSSGKDVINLLKKYGSKNNPITGIFFSTHGTPYAIDFNNQGNNLYIPEKDMKNIYENTFVEEKRIWSNGKNIAYVDDIVTLMNEGIIAKDVTITLCGCLNGATSEKVPATAEKVSLYWAKINRGKNPKNIAWYFSILMPEATVIANTTQVDSGFGLNSPVMYKHGEIVK